MNSQASGRARRAFLLVAAILLAGLTVGCSHRLHAPMQPDGWSAQPVVLADRFMPDADLDPATGAPVGDAGHFLYILTESPDWDFSQVSSLISSICWRPGAHSWLVLESPEDRLECGQTGDFGRDKPRYYRGVMQRIRDGHPDPIGYLWHTMTDGQLQIGQPNRPPTFVWRMPITQRRYRLIHDRLTQRNYDLFGVRSDNCTDLVAEIAELAGIHLIHRIHLTVPPKARLLGRTVRLWTDPQYRILEFSTPEVLEADLRQLARLGIGSDATKWYRTVKR